MAGNTLKIEKTGTASFQVVRQSADKGQSRGYLEGSDRIHSESIPFRNETAYECAASTDANASLGLPHMSFAKGRMPPACNAQRQRWHAWHPVQRGICKLQVRIALTLYRRHLRHSAKRRPRPNLWSSGKRPKYAGPVEFLRRADYCSLPPNHFQVITDNAVRMVSSVRMSISPSPGPGDHSFVPMIVKTIIAQRTTPHAHRRMILPTCHFRIAIVRPGDRPRAI